MDFTMSRLHESLSFLKRFLARPQQIGAVAPSSASLARALVYPLSQHDGPVNILEIGAGTGAVTRHIAPLVGPDDQLDICEADPALAAHVQSHCLDKGPLQEPYRQGRVRLFGEYLQSIEGLLDYDFIVSGLPLNAFQLRDIKSILDIVKRQAKADCVLSYFEYIGLRDLKAAVGVGAAGRQARYRSAYLNREIARHQFARRSVLWNIPPAYARHLRIGSTAA
jgi:phospholipid N-methyltransferase